MISENVKMIMERIENVKNRYGIKENIQFWLQLRQEQLMKSKRYLMQV